MKKISLITIYLLLISIKSYSQCSELKISYDKYPGICVENVINWLNMSRNEWKIEMQKYDFKSTGFEEGAPFFGTGDKHWDIGLGYFITKDFNLLKIENSPIADYKKDIFSNIVEELEPYFKRKNNGWNYFVFRYKDNNTYEIAINQSRLMDLIMVKKI